MASSGTVLVTGASSGIGKATVERLSDEGYHVVAGVRREGDAPSAASAEVLIDLADGASIAPACKQVLGLADRNGGLVALVNNAGINVAGPSEVVSLDDWRRQFEVNLFGQLAVTAELLPALIESGGHLFNVGSIGGRVSAPFLGPYSASKFAVRAWTDALRIELAPHGVRVVLIEPGAIATPMWAKGNSAVDDLEETLTEEQRRRYSSQINRVRKLAKFAESHAVPADQVARTISRALAAPKPTGHQLVGRDAWMQAFVSVFPTRLLDRVLRLVSG
jgi:NAD(P)-dependent dehydrogenase (short-subunit alcohol dehydrogenase family)